MTCWMIAETPPPQSWSTPPAAIKTLVTGKTHVADAALRGEPFPELENFGCGSAQSDIRDCAVI